MPRSTADAHPLERRTQARIRVQIPLTVTVSGRSEPLRAVSQDLSWGGVQLTLSEPLPQATQALHIVFPWRRDQSITAEAQILRRTRLANGRWLIAARFNRLSLHSQSRLERLLTVLESGAAVTDRTGPQALVRELEVSVEDSGELRRMQQQIATGRYTVTVFDAYAVDQSICFTLAGTRTPDSVRLRARVVAVRETSIHGADWAHLYNLTVEFEHPRAAIKTMIHRLYGPPSPDLEGEEPQATDAGRPRAAMPASRPTRSARSVSPCALEERFPELLNLLNRVWRC